MKTRIFISFVLLLLTADNHLTNSQWQQTAMTTGNVTTIKANSSYIFALKSSLYRTSDAGVSWESANMFCSDFCVTGQNIFAGTGGQPYISRSSDNGINWATVGLVNADGWFSVMASGNNIFASRYVIQRSTDGGNTWIVLQGIGSSWMECRAADGNLVFALSNHTYLYRSTNNGDNWVLTIFPQQVNSIAINGNTVYAGLNNIGVHISLNSGVSWNQSSLNNQSVKSLAVSGNNVFAGTQTSGVYYSSNAGANWIQKNEGLTNLRVDALLINGDYIYAGTYGAGVWKRPLSELVAVNIISSEVPDKYALEQNYPNPFNPKTIIRFRIKDSGFTTLRVFDILGNEASTLVNEKLKPGTYEADFDGSNLASGIYFYTLKTSDFTETKKMLLVK